MLILTSVALALVCQPPLPPEVLASPYGIVCPWPDVGEGGMGAVWCRCGARATALGDWPQLEPWPGVFRWAAAEEEWQNFYVREKLVPTPILAYTPQWASRAPQASDSTFRPPANLWDYFRFCRAIARRFAGRVWFWEVWNEPNIDFFAGTSAEYADLVKTAAVAVRAGNPRAYVVFGGLAGVDLPFLERCYQYGVQQYFDVMATHPYQWDKIFDDGWFADKLAGLRALMGRWGDGQKPLWLNEVGWSTGEAHISEADQARLLVQCYVTALARVDLGVERVFWFCVKDWGGPGYGLYAEDGRKKPAWYAYQAMVRQLRGLRCWGRLDVGAGRRAYVFADAQRRRCVLVLWSADLETRPVLVPLAEPPLAVQDVEGKALPVPKLERGALALAVGPAPTYVTVQPASIASAVRAAAPLAVALPDPARRPPAWLSLYPQPGCELPWLWRGQRTELRGRLWNASDRRLVGVVRVEVAARPDGPALAAAQVPIAVAPYADTVFTLPVPCPAQAPEQAWLRVRAENLGVRLPTLQLRCLPGDGPVLNFLANSYLERQWYLQPGDHSGTAESVRFGREWVYKLPVPLPCRAQVEMDVGAHQAGPWSVAWSQDGKNWQPLMQGRSERAWHRAAIPALTSGALWLRCLGEDEQVGEVIVRLQVRDPARAAQFLGPCGRRSA
jgi:hypothetical protein